MLAGVFYITFYTDRNKLYKRARRDLFDLHLLGDTSLMRHDVI
jgi:hypothetical protein